MPNSTQLSLKKKAKIERAKREKAKRNAKRSLIDFVQYIKPDYTVKWFHRVIAEHLDKVFEGEIQRLMISVPPQHGKSELSTRSFPAYVLGRDPNSMIAIASYSATIAEGFSANIQRRIDSDAYRQLFPEVKLPGRGEGKRTNNLFEIVGKNGYLMAVGRGGSLTSKTVDIGIIDDPLKDRAEAQSLTIRESLWGWYETVFETRLHNQSRQVVIQTRWDEDDLSGRLLERDGRYSPENPTGWHVISFPALKEKDENAYDPRKEGEALWPEKHSRERMEKIQRDSPLTFNALYQQDPKPSKEAMVYPNWGECQSFPECDTVFYGLDFGFSNDPTAIVKIGKVNNRLYLQEMCYETGLTNDDIAERIKALGIQGTVYCDSAEGKSIEELKRLGIHALPATKGPGSVNAGIDKVKTFEVYYTTSSPNIKKEVKKYQWIMQGSIATNEPIDAYNHLMDAVRYAVFTKYTKRRFAAA